MIKFYGYNKCSTCVKAKKLLTAKKVEFEDIDITSTPPTKKLLKDILASGDYELKDLFNRSGQLYRSMNMKEKVKTLSKEKLIDLLAENGKLVKRPIVSDGKIHTVGFDETKLKKAWG